MKIFESFICMTMTAAVIAVFAVPVFAQETDTASGGIGAFDIDKVYEDATTGDDTAFAASGTDGAYPYRQPENYALVLLRITGYLVIVTAIIFAAAWGIRKIGVAGVSKVGGGSNMDVIENIYIGQNRGAALIRVSDTVYLLGHTSENIVLIEKIEGDKAIDLIASAKGGAAITSFKDALNSFMGKMKKS